MSSSISILRPGKGLIAIWLEIINTRLKCIILISQERIQKSVMFQRASFWSINISWQISFRKWNPVFLRPTTWVVMLSFFSKGGHYRNKAAHMKDSFKRRDETLPPKLQCGEKDRGHQRTQSSNHFLLFILFDIKSLKHSKVAYGERSHRSCVKFWL